MTPRDIDTAVAWCWQSKFALRKIREAFDASNNVASALGVYVALTEKASNAECPIFQATHAALASLCGYSPRCVQARLKELAEIGLVGIETPDLRAASTFILLPVTQPLPNDTQPLPSVRQRGQNAPLPTLEEHKKKLFEKVNRRSVDENSNGVPDKDEILAYLKDKFPQHANLETAADVLHGIFEIQATAGPVDEWREVAINYMRTQA